MSDEWQTSVLAPIFEERGNATNCNTYNGVKPPEDALKIAERVLEKNLRICKYWCNAVVFHIWQRNNLHVVS